MDSGTRPNPFDYSTVPLLPSGMEHYTRVMHLQPGLHDSPLRATLRVARLSDPPTYEALSYTWGDSTEQRTITLNGTSLVPVTNNVFRALRGTRSCLKQAVLWVDALCINQANNAERAE